MKPYGHTNICSGWESNIGPAALKSIVKQRHKPSHKIFISISKTYNLQILERRKGIEIRL